MSDGGPAAASRAAAVEPGHALEVRHLRALAALADCGSMTAAAGALGVAQSTVSEAVASLERVLGVPVVARRRGVHGVALTSAGRALLPHARTVLAALAEAHQAVSAAAREVRTQVELVANESVGTYLLPRALAELRERWPHTRFAVTVGTCDDVRLGVANGRADAGLLLAHGEGGEGGRLLAAVPLVLFCAPSHPLARRPGPAPAREILAAYPVFSSDASGDFHALLDRFFRAGHGPDSRLESAGTVEAVKRSVLGTPRALGVLPAYALVEELASGQAHAVAVRPSLPTVRLEVLLSGARGERPVIAELVEALRRGLAEGRDLR